MNINAYTARLVEQSPSGPKLLPPCKNIEIKSIESQESWKNFDTFPNDWTWDP